MSRCHHLLNVAAGVANLVLLGHLIRTSGPVWPALLSGTAVASILLALALSSRQSRSPAGSASPPERIPVPTPAAVAVATVPEEVAGEPLENKPWIHLIEECVALHEELERLRPSLDADSAEFADHCCCRVQEILERSGVRILADDATFDPSHHQVESTGASPLEGTPIEATLSPGFAVGRRVLRRARVTLAPSLLPVQEPSS